MRITVCTVLSGVGAPCQVIDKQKLAPVMRLSQCACWCGDQVVDKHTLAPKRILSTSSGVVVPGELCALVGPSGAGGCLHCIAVLLRDVYAHQTQSLEGDVRNDVNKGCSSCFQLCEPCALVGPSGACKTPHSNSVYKCVCL